MKKFIVIIPLLLIALVLISGCTQTPTVNTDNGILIKDFYADPSEVEENEYVTLILNVENVGGVDATNVIAELGGVQNEWRDTAGVPVQGPLQQWTGPGGVGVTLEAPNPLYQQPGETRQTTWTLKTPVVGEGISLPSTVTAYVTFDYVTTGSVQIKAISKDAYRVMQGKGETVTNPLIVVNSDGPLKISVESASTPWIVDPARFLSGTPETSSFLVKLYNVGDGFPYLAANAQSGRQLGSLTGKLTIHGPAKFVDCLGQQNPMGQDVVFLNAGNIDWVKLSKSRGEYPVGCTIKITESQWPVTQDEDTIRIEFELLYRYYIKQDAQITVRGLSRTMPNV